METRKREQGKCYWAGVILCLMVVSGVAVGTPDWRTTPLGLAPTTYQEWTFNNANDPAVPEISDNLFGTAIAGINATGYTQGSAPGWYTSYMGRSGVWVGNKTIVTMTIPNNPVPNDYKEIWVEIGGRGHFPPDVPNPPMEGDSLGLGYEVLSPTGSAIEFKDLGYTIENTYIEYQGQLYEDGWKKVVFGLRIYPNPASETIRFTLLNSGADIDYIIVDTICIPEPATLALLVLGGLLCRRHK